MATTNEDVYCTLLMGDAYLPGAAVLAHSLRDAGTQRKLACLIVQDTLRPSTITELQSLYNYVIPVDRIGNPSPANLYLMNRPDLLYAFTKINLWRLTQFRKIVYIDADVVALRAPDELFDTKETFAAAPDIGWPDAFNTGVMVLSPHMGVFWALKNLAATGDSFDGADQGLINQYYEHKPWKRLSFSYNCTPSASYQYEPAYRYYKRDISLVHFIGKGKPWQQNRHLEGASTAFHELLGRWWAVYDHHFKVHADDYIASGLREYRSQEVQQEVPKSAHQTEQTYATAGYPANSSQSSHPQISLPAEALSTGADVPFTEHADEEHATDQGHVGPTPVVEQRRFSAPVMEWDGTRSAPPSLSKPEAANFPTQIYEFNNDPAPFRPPAMYPDPPKDMWFDVPKEPPRQTEKPKPIFPWEDRQLPIPSRVFVEDQPPQSGDPGLEHHLEVSGLDEFEVTADEALEPITPNLPHFPSAPWQDFGAVNKNAWDEVSGIENYVRSLTAFQKNRGKVQVLHQQLQPRGEASSGSQLDDSEPVDLVQAVKQRRESLILTDFPSEIERPSLPVTPAPRRRTTFWGTERDMASEMPAAEGVPEQADWDPNAQLEQLRRTSLLGPDDLKLPSKKSIPSRAMPEHSALLSQIPEPPEQDGAIPAIHAAQSLAVAASDEAELQSAKAPLFNEPDFSGQGIAKSDPLTVEPPPAIILSPTET